MIPNHRFSSSSCSCYDCNRSGKVADEQFITLHVLHLSLLHCVPVISVSRLGSSCHSFLSSWCCQCCQVFLSVMSLLCFIWCLPSCLFVCICHYGLSFCLVSAVCLFTSVTAQSFCLVVHLSLVTIVCFHGCFVTTLLSCLFLSLLFVLSASVDCLCLLLFSNYCCLPSSMFQSLLFTSITAVFSFSVPPACLPVCFCHFWLAYCLFAFTPDCFSEWLIHLSLCPSHSWLSSWLANLSRQAKSRSTNAPKAFLSAHTLGKDDYVVTYENNTGVKN